MSIASEHLLEIREMVKDHLAKHEENELTPAQQEVLKAQFRARLEKEDAALVAHYYTADVVQDLAEETGGMVGDSLEMARFGADHPGPGIFNTVFDDGVDEQDEKQHQHDNRDDKANQSFPANPLFHHSSA